MFFIVFALNGIVKVFMLYIFSWTFKKRELYGNLYSAKISTYTVYIYILLRKVSTYSAIQTFEVFYFFSQIDRIYHNSWRLCIIPYASHVLLVLPYLRSEGTWVTCESHLLEIPGSPPDFKGRLAHNFICFHLVLAKTLTPEYNENIDIILIYRGKKI